MVDETGRIFKAFAAQFGKVIQRITSLKVRFYFHGFASFL